MSLCFLKRNSKKLSPKLLSATLISGLLSGREFILGQLHAAGCDFDTQDNAGITPVMCACANSHFGILALLLRKGKKYQNKIIKLSQHWLSVRERIEFKSLLLNDKCLKGHACTFILPRLVIS